MPPRDFERGQIFFGNEEGEFRLLGELVEVEPDENCEVSEGNPFLSIGRSCEFTVEINPPEKMTFGDMILMLYGFDAEKLKQNNWRKMHGMVMHRRCGKRKLSKNGKTGRRRRNSGRKISG